MSTLKSFLTTTVPVNLTHAQRRDLRKQYESIKKESRFFGLETDKYVFKRPCIRPRTSSSFQKISPLSWIMLLSGCPMSSRLCCVTRDCQSAATRSRTNVELLALVASNGLIYSLNQRILTEAGERVTEESSGGNASVVWMCQRSWGPALYSIVTARTVPTLASSSVVRLAELSTTELSKRCKMFRIW